MEHSKFPPFKKGGKGGFVFPEKIPLIPLYKGGLNGRFNFRVFTRIFKYRRLLTWISA
jgi:hypothetical protein